MLRHLLLSLIACGVVGANASTFNVPVQSGAQKEFASALEARNWKQALFSWNQAHSGSNFAATATGLALHDYLLLQNGLTLTGTEHVLTLDAKKIHPELLNLWKVELKNSTFVQKAWLSNHKSWNGLIGPGEMSMALNNKKQIEKAMATADKLSKEMLREKALIWWQVGTRAPLINETSVAIVALKKLSASGQTVIGKDQIDMAMARVVYQRGDLAQALQFYSQVPKSSDLWLEAVEERAWAHLRNSDYDRALGEITTVLSPTFDKLLGPEPYFLSNLLSLKACDYPRIFKVGDTFKKRNRERLVELQAIVTQGTNKAIAPAFEQIDQKGVRLEALGKQVQFLPRALLKDRMFKKNMEYRHTLLTETRIAGEIAANTSALGNNLEMDKLLLDNRVKADQARSKAMARVRQLATAEVKEYKQILNKMHIIEAEVIQRLHVDENLKGERSKLAKVEDTGEVLSFPYSEDHDVWIDELDNYRARVKDCPTLKGAGL